MTRTNGSGDLLSGGGGMGSLHAMGVLNALRTGDPRVDMILAMCFPVFVQTGVDALKKVKRWFKWDLKIEKGPKLHYRTIVHKAGQNGRNGSSSSSGSAEEDTRNPILMKAIQLYLHAKVNLNLREADVDLTPTESGVSSASATTAEQIRARHHLRHLQRAANANGSNGTKSTADVLSSYEIIQKPPPKEWHDIGTYGDPATTVHFKLERQEEQSSGNKGGGSRGGGDSEGGGGNATQVTRRSFHFKSESGDAIDAFVAECYRWYVETLRSTEDRARYFYELKPNRSLSFGADDDNDSQNNNKYRRYRLSDEKSFESLFFEEKEPLLRMVDAFLNQTGKYAIKGIPSKLGILLHGPPGSGKTSLIKALAQHTGRNIVNIPLARVKTNTQLMSIFFDEKRQVDGSYGVPVNVGFKDCIFVMEDIDAATDVVKRRDGKKPAGKGKKGANNRAAGIASAIDELSSGSATKSLWHMLLESNESNCKRLVKLLMEKSDRLKKDAINSGILLDVARRMTAFPELGLMGNQNPVLQKMGKEALTSAKSMMNGKKAVQNFLSENAALMIEMIQHGLAVDDKLVEELLAPPLARALANQMNDDEDSDDEDDAEDAVVTETSSTVSSNTGQGMPQLAMMGPPVDAMGPYMKMMMRAGGGLGRDDQKSKLTGMDDVDGMRKSGRASWWDRPGEDDLNLSGLLNVLDGVVDSPGRIVVMTTNHVEHLDPALIRPGRIDKMLLLGYMTAPDVVDMLEHYFEVSLTQDLRERVVAAMGGSEGRPRMKLTPAQVEQLTVEHDRIESMVQALEIKRQELFYPTEIVRVDSAAGAKRGLELLEGGDEDGDRVAKRIRTTPSQDEESCQTQCT